MDHKTYKNFLFQIKNCSNNRLTEIIDETLKERRRRESEEANIKKLVSAISKIASDWEENLCQKNCLGAWHNGKNG